MQKGVPQVPMTAKAPGISEETRKRIEAGLQNWDNADSEERRRFEESQQKLSQSEAYRRLEASIAASERLTAADFAIRINTRD